MNRVDVVELVVDLVDVDLDVDLVDVDLDVDLVDVALDVDLVGVDLTAVFLFLGFRQYFYFLTSGCNPRKQLENPSVIPVAPKFPSGENVQRYF